MFRIASAIQAAEAKEQQCISKQEDPKGADHPEPCTVQELGQIRSVADVIAGVQVEEAGGQ